MMHTLGFYNWGAAFVMPFRAGFAFSQKPFLQLQYQIGVFTMCGGDDAKLLRQAQRLIKLFIRDTKRALVCQKHFKTRDATLHNFSELFFSRVVIAGNTHVKSKIARAVALRFAEPQFECGHWFFRARWTDHLDKSCRPTD